MEKKFKTSYKTSYKTSSIDSINETVVSILHVKKYELDNHPWLSFKSVNERGYSHEGSFILTKDIAFQLAAYFIDLTKELE